jgi:hypothetical protein
MGMNQHQRTTERNRTDGGCLLVPIDLRLLEGRDLGSPGGRIHARATPPLSVPNLQLKSEGGGKDGGCAGFPFPLAALSLSTATMCSSIPPFFWGEEGVNGVQVMVLS